MEWIMKSFHDKLEFVKVKLTFAPSKFIITK